jgi:hypothetical protein
MDRENDPLNAARGIVLALKLALPFWGAVAFAVWWLA